MLRLEGHSGSITALAFACDATTMASAATNGVVRIWDAHGRAHEWKFSDEAIHCLAFSPDGSYLAFGGGDRHLRILDVRANRLMSNVGPQQHSVTAVAFIGDGTILYGIGERQGPVARPSTLFLLDLATGKPRRFPFDVVHGIRAIATIPHRKLAAWATDTKLLRLQDVSRPPGRTATLRNDCRALAIAGDGRQLAVASDWEIVLFPLDNWPTTPQTLGRHLGAVSALAFGPDGRALLSGSWDGTVRVWDLDRGLPSASFLWPVGNRVTALAVSPDGLRAAVGGDSGSIVVWDLD